MENFVVSARKYRPATFESVVGQKHITETLKNAIERNQLAHAYLFCGPRGVGKTTCARIFAKSINCLTPQHGSTPCGVCESCVGFESGRSINIHELDAASNNSVDDIRTLIEQVRIVPQVGRYSLFIIDEVHMLSTAAFNAFLKTLEEPPAHAIFILATTERHKILPTILSRCQCYDFNRIKVEDGAEYLRYIANTEGVTIDDESLNLIAQKADGGMRDALSMFDKAVSFGGNSLDFRVVAQTLGVVDYDTYFSLTDSLLGADYASALVTFDGVLGSGFGVSSFLSGYARHLRDLLVAKEPMTLKLMELTDSLAKRYASQAARCEVDFLFSSISLLTTIDAELRRSSNQRLLVELGLMKMAGLGQKKNIVTQPSLPPLDYVEPKQEVVKTEVVKPAVVKVEEVKVKTEPTPPPAPKPIPKPAPAPQPQTQKRASIFGIDLNTNAKAEAKSKETEVQNAAERVIDRDAASKLEAVRSKIVGYIGEERPRFRPLFEQMRIENDKIVVEVSSSELEEELKRAETEMMTRILSIAGVSGYVALDVVVNEEVKALRPIKLEDRIAHFTTNFPLTLELTKALDLQADS